jgi:hypothetical protein
LPRFDDFAFDFLASESELAQKSNEALAQWLTKGIRPTRTGPAVLLDSEGHLLESRIQDLVRERDNRPVTIKE